MPSAAVVVEELKENKEMNSLDNLFQKYISNTITHTEFETFKEGVNSTDSAQLEELLEKQWNEFTSYNSTPTMTAEQIISKLGLEPHSPVNKPTVRFGWIKAAAVALILLLSGTSTYLFYQYGDLKQFLAQQSKVNVNSGERAQLILPDGTVVQLNAQTQLHYPSNFGFNNRTVELQGEAMFTVTSDSLRPFVVQTSDVEIEVLGTKFNISAYPTEPIIETSLVEGAVKITTKGDNPVSEILSPCQKAIFDKQTGLLIKTDTDLRFETAWLNGELIFRSVTFDQLLKRLGRHYGFEFSVQGNTSGFDRYTGTFMAANMSEVLNVLRLHYPISYLLNGDQAVIMVKQ